MITGLAETGDRRLGEEQFNDCKKGSIRVEIDLLTLKTYKRRRVGPLSTSEIIRKTTLRVAVMTRIYLRQI